MMQRRGRDKRELYLVETKLIAELVIILGTSRRAHRVWLFHEKSTSALLPFKAVFKDSQTNCYWRVLEYVREFAERSTKRVQRKLAHPGTYSTRRVDLQQAIYSQNTHGTWPVHT